MKEVTKALVDQKVSGRRMLIEEVEGSSDDEESAPSVSAGQEPSSNVKATDSHAQDLVNDSDTNNDSAHKLMTDEMKDEDSQMLLRSVCGGGDADSGGTEAVSQHQQSVTAEGDTALPDDNMSPAVLALKDAGNELFRKGQYGDALDKYSAAVQLLGKCHVFCFV